MASFSASLPGHEDAEDDLSEPGFNTTQKRALLMAGSTAPYPNNAETMAPRQPSILDLLTALPLLLSLDRSEYDDTLNSAQGGAFASPTSEFGHERLTIAPFNSNRLCPMAATRHSEDCLDVYGDAATTAVMTVLRAGGSAAWQSKRRRLRKAALDAFFRPSLSLKISARMGVTAAAATTCGGSAEGVHRATARLLAHTRAVMADVSPTQAHLVDLLVDRILQDRLEGEDAGGAVVGSLTTVYNQDQESSLWSTEQLRGQLLSAASPEKIKTSTQSSPRGIMNASTWTIDSATKSASTSELARPHMSSSPSIAEQLLYIILRTSIAANTPLPPDHRDDYSDFCNGQCTANEGGWGDGLLHSPSSQAAWCVDAVPASSPTSTPSSTGSFIRKKPRPDALGSLGAVAGEKEVPPARSSAALFQSGEAESIRYHPGSTASGRGSTRNRNALPYEPQCWLGPSVVALVENSDTLRRQQRWTCDPDPVIEATITDDAAAPFRFFSGGTVVSAPLFVQRSHWAPLSAAAAASSENADVLVSLVRDSGLPFQTSATNTTAAAGAAAASAASTFSPPAASVTGVWRGDGEDISVWAPSPTGVLHWGVEYGAAYMREEADPAVQSLLTGMPPPTNTTTTDTRLQDDEEATAGAAKQRARKGRSTSLTVSMPACHTPFVACRALYDSAVYAHVYFALHRCTAGLVDPFELTYYDTRAGSHLVEICVRPEFLASVSARQTKPSTRQQPGTARSGLLSMLEWGCRCGTLLLRLRCLCDVADDTTLRASLGNYGRCAIDTLRLLLSLLQRQIWELGDRAGGWHRLGFTELLTAQQRLQAAAAQVEALAAFFSVPSTPVAAAVVGAGARTNVTGSATSTRASSRPAIWDPVTVLRENCSSALLVSRLHRIFTTRHANALGQHGDVAVFHCELQAEESMGEWVTSHPLPGAADGALTDTTTASERQRRRKDLLSRSIDAIGLLLRATLRPLHTMLHRWLTAGEIADPYDEFFVVPSHGQTHSGFTLDLSPQRLPVFISAAAAKDLLHAGVSLRVLRAAATHVVRCAQKDARRLQGLAEATEAAAEDYADALLDTQTLQSAIEKFIERLVHGAPTTEEVNAAGQFCYGAADSLVGNERGLPLPPRVDVLSAYGAIHWWRQHYQACTQVLLDAVEEAAGVAGEEKGAKLSSLEAGEVDGRGATRAAAGAPSASSAAASPASGSSSLSKGTSRPPSSLAQASAAVAVSDEEAKHTNNDQVHMTVSESFANAKAPTPLFYPPGLASVADSTHQPGTASSAHASEQAGDDEPPYVTVFMNSDDDDEDGLGGRTGGRPQRLSAAAAGAHSDAASVFSASSTRSASSAATTSVLGLRRIAGSTASVGTTVSSSASSRGTLALYGAITEELRQVSLLERQTEALAGQSRHALRAEFTAQMWRRRREMRMEEWKAQRLALRLRRVRAMEHLVEELREVYGIRGVGDADAPPPPSTPTLTRHDERNEEVVKGEEGINALLPPEATVQRFVVPLKHLPPVPAPPPVVLYADDALGDAGWRGGRGGSSYERERPRRTSFATTTTVVERPGDVATSTLRQHRRSSSYALPSPLHPVSALLPPRAPRTRSGSGPSFLIATPAAQDKASSHLQQKPPAVVCLPPSHSLGLQLGTDWRCRSSPAATTHTFEDGQHARVCDQGGEEGGDGRASEGTASPLHPHSSENSSAVHQRSRDIPFSAAQKSSCSEREQITGAAPSTLTTVAYSSDSSEGPHSHQSRLASHVLTAYCNEEQHGTEAFQAQWYRTATRSLTASPHTARCGDDDDDDNEETRMATNDDVAARVRRDELGYAHPDACYVVADINDDDFLFLRTGPKRYERRHAEDAAVARLAAGRAALDRCTVDEPDFVRQLTCTARALLATTEKEEGEAADGLHLSKYPPIKEAPGAAADDHQSTLPLKLSDAWRGDDPHGQLLRRRRLPPDAAYTRDGSGNSGCHDALWAWTPAEAHRWYFDHRMPLHHALTEREVDRVFFVDLPLTSDEAEALQCCGGYYRALGQYTSSFLTHKALQLTLLPPYGSLYRLATQFLDVCLLQRPSVAVRIVDTWIAAVDAALEMMAEQEEATMVRAAVSGDTHMPAPLASLTDAQQGLNLTKALSSLNAVFQQEWATCVENGESTVKLEWRLMTTSAVEDGQRGRVSKRGGSASPRLGATQPLPLDEECAAEMDSDDNDDNGDAFDGAAPSLGWRHHDPLGASQKHGSEERAGESVSIRTSAKTTTMSAAQKPASRTRSSPIQVFLASLELIAVSPWCSGAWLLPDCTTRCFGGICRALLFWKSVERVVLHTWRAGMNSGLSSVFFFCTTVRQVLLPTLQEQLWGRLTELTATYRESLRFEAGVLYTYRALESFTVDHEKFLQDCEFYTLCGAPFQRRVQPLLRAMMREVEVAERALRFSQVSLRVARRQYMATFHSMVSSDSSSSDEDRPDLSTTTAGTSTTSSTSALRRQHPPVAKTVNAASHGQHVFTPSRWSRHHHRRPPTCSATGGGGGAGVSRQQSTPCYLQRLEEALAQQQQQQQKQGVDDKAGGGDHLPHGAAAGEDTEATPISRKRTAAAPAQKAFKANRSASSSVATTLSTRSGGGGSRKAALRERSTSAFSSSTTTTKTSVGFSAAATHTEEDDEEDEDDDISNESKTSSQGSGKGGEEDVSSSHPAVTAAATTVKRRKKRRRRPTHASTKAAVPPRRSIMESATMNTTPIYAAVLATRQRQAQETAAATSSPQKRSRSGGVGVCRGSASLHPPVVDPQSTSLTAAPATKRYRQQQQDHGPRHHRRGPRDPQMTPAERQERREQLRSIAHRKIQDEAERQRRRMRDVIARRLRCFAALTQSLRDALSDVIASEDLAAQATVLLHTTEGSEGTGGVGVSSIPPEAAKELHDAQRKQLSRFTYLSSMVRRLDSLIEVMASQV
jgi:hypothetical protein